MLNINFISAFIICISTCNRTLLAFHQWYAQCVLFNYFPIIEFIIFLLHYVKKYESSFTFYIHYKIQIEFELFYLFHYIHRLILNTYCIK